MSQIGSSSGVRIAAQPLSNVYTVLLLLAAVALVATAVMLAVTMDSRYGAVLGVTEESKQAKREAQGAPRSAEFPEARTKTHYDQAKAKLDEGEQNLKQFPEGAVPPAVGGGTTPPAPVAPTPPAPVAPAPPAPAPPAPAAPTPPAGEATPPAPAGEATPPAAPPAGAPAAN
ncbi:MAG TPA: hypothetical protein VM238_17815 [Phycisphaerae bacterium]|nr:hypothetical protein [Phycisphaerae bacterium]